MIYGPFGGEISKLRRAQLADVQRFESREPDDIDKESVHRGSYVIVTWADNGQEAMTHLGKVRADGGWPEIRDAMEGEWRCVECGDLLPDEETPCSKKRCQDRIIRRQRRMGVRR